MRPEALLRNFETVTGAPRGVQRLRNLILELATRGQLVPQSDADQPAREALGLSPHTPGAVAIAERYELPTGWAWARFDQVAETRLGKMLDKAKNAGPLRPYLRNANVQWFRFDLQDIHELRLEDEHYEAHALRAGDLVICEGGEPGRAAVCDDTVDGLVFQKALHRARPQLGMSAWYLAYFLRSSAGNGQLALSFTGATINHLTGRSLAALPVPVPPPAEQKRIVAKVHEMMRLCDELDARQHRRAGERDRYRRSALHSLVGAKTDVGLNQAWNQISANFEAIADRVEDLPDLRHAVLALASAGRLARQNPGDESADELLTKVAAEQARLGQAGVLRGVRPTTPVTNRPPWTVPESWRWVRLGSVLSHCRNGIATKPNDVGHGYPLLRISAGTSDPGGVVDLGDHKFADLDPVTAQSYVVEPGDLLACRFNGNLHYVGKVAIVPEHSGVFLHPDKLIRLKPIFLDPGFLAIVLNSVGTRHQIENAASTTAGNIGINGAQLQALQIPIPPLAEQERIAERVKDLLERCKRLSQTLPARDSAAELAADALCRSLLTGEG